MAVDEYAQLLALAAIEGAIKKLLDDAVAKGEASRLRKLSAFLHTAANTVDAALKRAESQRH